MEIVELLLYDSQNGVDEDGNVVPLESETIDHPPDSDDFDPDDVCDWSDLANNTVPSTDSSSTAIPENPRWPVLVAHATVGSATRPPTRVCCDPSDPRYADDKPQEWRLGPGRR